MLGDFFVRQDTLLDSFRAGRRNYTVFQVGKATLLRVSDVMTLKKSDVYNPDGSVNNTAFIHDKKTGKANTLYLKPVHNLDISASIKNNLHLQCS